MLFRSALLTLTLLPLTWLPALGQAAGQGHSIDGAPNHASSLALPVGGFLPGHNWFSYTLMDNTWGYTEPYFSVGTVQGLHQDNLHGWWFVDGRMHATVEGSLFGNLGLGRRFHLKPAATDVSLAVYYDFDGDKPGGGFGHTFNQIGITGDIRNECADFVVNGYIPVGDTQLIEDIQTFQGNRIVLPGRDIALTGFDMVLSVRPSHLQMFHGRIDVGGYYYRCDLDDIVSPFGGLRLGLGVTPVPSVQIDMEANFDERFGTTGQVRFTCNFGGHESFSPTQRGLEPVRRNQHIARVWRQRAIAINPDTGLPYNVIHVDNGFPAPGLGTFENRYNDLSFALNNSAQHDVVMVWGGVADYDVTPPDTTFQLLDNQRLLADGVPHTLPVQFKVGGRVEPFNLDVNIGDAFRPTLRNTQGPTIVSLANDDLVSGFFMDGGPGGNTFAVQGTNITDGQVDRNNIFDVTGSGVDLVNVAGSVLVQSNDMDINGDNGVTATNVLGTLTVQGNAIQNATNDGVNVQTGPGTVSIVQNTVDSPGDNGVEVVGVTGAVTVDQNSLTGGTTAILLTNLPSMVSASGNTITTPAIDGIFANNFGGVANSQGTFSNNTITTPGDQGIHVVTAVGGARIFSNNNNITDVTGEGIRLEGVVINSFVNNNNITVGAAGGADAIFIDGATGSLEVNGNNIAVTPGAGLNGIFLVNSSANMTVSNNTVADAFLDGIHFEPMAVGGRRIDVAGNTVTDALDDGISLVGMDNTTIVLSTNVVDRSGNVGIRLNTGNNTSFSMEGDTVRDSFNEGVQVAAITGDVTLIGDVTLTGNGLANDLAGLSVTLNGIAGDTLDIAVRESVINGNGEGVFVFINGPANVNTSIFRNFSISQNNNNGAYVGTDGGARHTVSIRQNTISENGVAVQAVDLPFRQYSGNGISFRTDGTLASGRTSVEVEIEDNTLIDNAGDTGAVTDTDTSGIFARTDGNSNFFGVIQRNTITSPAANPGADDAIQLEYNNTVNNLNRMVINDNDIDDMDDNGIVIEGRNMAKVDLNLLGNQVDTVDGFGHLVFLFDDALVRIDIDDSVTRQSIFQDAGVDNIGVEISDDSRLIMTVSNTELLAAGQDGLNAISFDDATMVLDLLNNTIGGTPANANTQFGVQLQAFDSSTFYSIARRNAIENNTLLDYTATLELGATALAIMGIEFTGNTTDTPATFNNNSGAGEFRLDFEGNAGPPPDLNGPIIQTGVNIPTESFGARIFPIP